MAEFILHSWFVSIRTGLEWANALSKALPSFSLRLKCPVKCRTGHPLDNRGDRSNEEALLHCPPLQLFFAVSQKQLYSQTFDREHNMIFCAVLSGDNMDADIMQLQPRLVACRRVDFVFR
jgi:hypothetical protein